MVQTLKNRNFLSPLRFNFQIEKLVDVDFNIQRVNLPGISLPKVDVKTPFTNLNFQGDHLEFDNLIVQFVVDEDMRGYYEVWNWMNGLGFPENFDQYKEVKEGKQKDLDGNPRKRVGPVTREGDITSDATLIISTSHNNPQFEVTFKDLSPISISELQFDSTLEDDNDLTCTIIFGYTNYTIKRT